MRLLLESALRLHGKFGGHGSGVVSSSRIVEVEESEVEKFVEFLKILAWAGLWST